VGTDEDCEQARDQAGSFGLFIRSLVGLDRSAAKEAFGQFPDDQANNASQIEFVNLIIDDLSQNGIVNVGRFYESPFTDSAHRAPKSCSPPRRSMSWPRRWPMFAITLTWRRRRTV
jgi:type I restriction enzyme R subunit